MRFFPQTPYRHSTYFLPKHPIERCLLLQDLMLGQWRQIGFVALSLTHTRTHKLKETNLEGEKRSTICLSNTKQTKCNEDDGKITYYHAQACKPLHHNDLPPPLHFTFSPSLRGQMDEPFPCVLFGQNGEKTNRKMQTKSTQRINIVLCVDTNGTGERGYWKRYGMRYTIVIAWWNRESIGVFLCIVCAASKPFSQMPLIRKNQRYRGFLF